MLLKVSRQQQAGQTDYPLSWQPWISPQPALLTLSSLVEQGPLCRLRLPHIQQRRRSHRQRSRSLSQLLWIPALS